MITIHDDFRLELMSGEAANLLIFNELNVYSQ